MKSNEWLAQTVIVAGDVVVSTATETSMAGARWAANTCWAYQAEQFATGVFDRAGHCEACVCAEQIAGGR